ncbi:hypothetical protein CMO96_04690 [Candidatus Woesebacteria bacterium]|nr:hypothetical protein [Candidatus Woesebacteria bacterium]
MERLITPERLNIKGKRILLRADLDVDVENGKVSDDTRLQAVIPTIRYLVENGSGRITVIGHRGRPKGQKIEDLSLKPVSEHLEGLLIEEVGKEAVGEMDMSIMENLRFDPGEDSNDKRFVEHLAHDGDVYINDAFSVSHRESASIVGLPKVMPHAAGLHLAEEIENLSKVLKDPKKPVVFVVGGGKGDKEVLIDKFLDHAEWVLVGGVLPQTIKSYCREEDGKMCVSAAHLNREGADITPDSARNFAEVIKGAGTIVWNGPMGDIDSGFWDGTKVIADAVVENRSAFKVIGGGDTIRLLKKLGFLERMDYVSTGGGAMLEFLAYGDLPGLKALRE